MIQNIVIRPHRRQREILQNRNRFNVIRCGRRFGKSYLAFALALEKMLENKNNSVLYTVPANVDLKNRYKEAVRFFTPLGAECKWGEITLNNSTLDLSGIWRADALRGNHYDRYIGDEFAHCINGEPAWEESISATLGDSEGDAYFFSTPKGKNYFHYLDSLSEVHNDWKSFHYTTYQGGQISEKEIERQKVVLPSVVFAQEYLAEYVDRDAAKIKRDWIKIANDKKCLAYYIGVDLAISQKETADYTAIVVIGLTAENEIVVVEAKRGRWSFVEIGSEIVAMESKWQAKVVAVESNQAQAYMVQELKRNTRMNVIGVVSTRDKITRFQPVEARYEQGLVYHVSHLAPEYTDELLSFTGTPQDKHDDFIDAIGHAFSAIRKTPTILI